MASYTEVGSNNNKGIVHTPITHHHNSNNNQISFGMMESPSSPFPATFNINNDGGTYDLGELDQALFSYLDGHDHEDDKQGCGMRPHTLNIFPSQPMHHHAVEPSSAAAAAKPNRSGFVSPVTSAGSKRSSDPVTNPKKKYALKREGNRRGPSLSSEQDGPKTPDPKTLRRLAQNREAARKSRLRKKAYVQQLESSRVRLAQLEQEIQRARSQGIYLGGNGLVAGDQGLSVSMNNNNTSSDAAVFDMEYARWVEEHHRLTVKLRRAVEEHLPENELRVFVDSCLAHYDQVISLKSMIAKSDVFHLVSGSWKTPAERCFMWIGGFRPSELIKIILRQVEPLSEQQVMGICRLQQWMQDAEDGVTQGVEALNQSISETITSHSLSVAPNMNNYMSQMAVAINKLSALQSFVRQADNLRHQTLHRLHQILTTRQAARCFLALAEYFHRLRALSSLWLARPRQQ